MPDRSYELGGCRIFECGAEGTLVGNDRDAADLLSAAWGHRANFLVIPVARLSADFFRLSTRAAGEIVQKFANYGMRVAIVGDISGYVAESSALRDFVYEANQGARLWFVPAIEEVTKRLLNPQNKGAA